MNRFPRLDEKVHKGMCCNNPTKRLMRAWMKTMLIFSPREKESVDRILTWFHTLGVNIPKKTPEYLNIRNQLLLIDNFTFKSWFFLRVQGSVLIVFHTNWKQKILFYFSGYYESLPVLVSSAWACHSLNQVKIKITINTSLQWCRNMKSPHWAIRHLSIEGPQSESKKMQRSGQDIKWQANIPEVSGSQTCKAVNCGSYVL